ncbi:MAG: hypothetical protein IJP44_00450 [Bacteroidales bacterium]|nr:hypothetical protein [Bacteroidales bacterium]
MKKTMFFMLIAIATAVVGHAQGRAEYSPVFVPQLKAELPHEVHETSSLFFHNGRLWTHNDSGGKPILYALDTVSFGIVQKITLAHAKNKDWEDVCTDGVTVFVGDFGNNKGNRKDLKIYTFPLSAIPDEGDATVKVDSICFAFGDQTDFTKRKVHDFDCEAIFATEEYLYMFSKGWATGTTRLYRLPKTPGKHVAKVVNGFDSQGLITGADYDPKSRTLVVIGYVKSLYKPFLYLIYGFDEKGVKLSHRRFEMPQWAGAQTEGVCFFDEGRCFVSAETSKAFTARVFVADFRKWIVENREQSH